MSNAVLRKPLVACCMVLALALAATLVAWIQARSATEAQASKLFAEQARDVAGSFTKRFAEYESLLRAGAALVELSRDMPREEWARFTVRVDSTHRYPGMRALGLAVQIAPHEAAALERRVRREGVPQYRMRTAPESAGYMVPVVSSEPQGDNFQALGFDLASDPVRRAALEAARDSGRPAITGKLTLVDDGASPDRAGFVVYAPLYRPDAAVSTVARRRKAIQGYVFGAFRMSEVMEPLLGEVPAALHVAVYDRAQPEARDLLFDTQALRPGVERRHPPRHQIDVPIEIGQSTWTLRFTSRPAFEAATHSVLPGLTLGCGIALGLLLTALVYAIARTRERAEALAAQITQELRDAQLSAERNRRFLDAIVHAIPQAV
jgi:CHASE1-domain containing sensor protein